jgi:hypothetical protein
LRQFFSLTKRQEKLAAWGITIISGEVSVCASAICPPIRLYSLVFIYQELA